MQMFDKTKTIGALSKLYIALSAAICAKLLGVYKRTFQYALRGTDEDKVDAHAMADDLIERIITMSCPQVRLFATSWCSTHARHSAVKFYAPSPDGQLGLLFRKKISARSLARLRRFYLGAAILLIWKPNEVLLSRRYVGCAGVRLAFLSADFVPPSCPRSSMPLSTV